MTSRPRAGAHWSLQRTVLADAGRSLITHAEREQRTHADLGIAKTDWYRLAAGTAGFALVVKAAMRLGLSVSILLGVPDPTQEPED